MLFKEVIDEFLTYLVVELNRSPSTHLGYAKDLRIFVQFLEKTGQGELTVGELSPELLGAYLRHLTRDRGCGPNTVRRRITALRSCCAYLVDCAYLTHNPALRLPLPRRPLKQPRYLLRDEVEKIFLAIPEDVSPTKLRDKTLLMFMYYSGVRVAELVDVKSKDLDLAGGFVRIVKGKGGRFRRIPVHHRLQAQLNKYFSGAASMVGEHLFCNRHGGKLSTDYIHEMLGEYACKAGLNKTVTPHMLRHSFATHLYREAVDINTLSKLLGHAGIRSTAIYTHTDLTHLRAGVDQLNTPRRLEAALFDPGGKRS